MFVCTWCMYARMWCLYVRDVCMLVCDVCMNVMYVCSYVMFVCTWCMYARMWCLYVRDVCMLVCDVLYVLFCHVTWGTILAKRLWDTLADSQASNITSFSEDENCSFGPNVTFTPHPLPNQCCHLLMESACRTAVQLSIGVEVGGGGGGGEGPNISRIVLRERQSAPRSLARIVGRLSAATCHVIHSTVSPVAPGGPGSPSSPGSPWRKRTKSNDHGKNDVHSRYQQVSSHSSPDSPSRSRHSTLLDNDDLTITERLTHSWAFFSGLPRPTIHTVVSLKDHAWALSPALLQGARARSPSHPTPEMVLLPCFRQKLRRECFTYR